MTRDRWIHTGGVGDDPTLTLGRVALVENDDRLGTGLLGIERLGPEEAGPTLDECDVIRTAEVEAGEVCRLAAARGGPVADEVDVDRDDIASLNPPRAAAGEDAGFVLGLDR